MLMCHVAERWERARRDCPGAGRGHRPAAAVGVGKPALPPNVLGAASSQLPAVFQRSTDFINWHLDAEHRSGLAGLSIDRFEIASRSGDRRQFRANAPALYLGWLYRRSPFQAQHRALDASRDD